VGPLGCPVVHQTGLEMAMGPDPRFPAGNSSIKGWGWGRFSPRGDVNGEKSSPDGDPLNLYMVMFSCNI
jgi:hypothetical protein